MAAAPPLARLLGQYGMTVVDGLHTIVLWAEGTTSAEDQIDTIVSPALFLGDGNRDGDGDGLDVAALNLNREEAA